MDITLLQARDLIHQSDVIAVATETVYGLAASIDRPEAIEKIFSLKGRPKDNPLIIHVAKVADLLPFLKYIPDDFSKVANAFWPGPLTIVLPVFEEKISPHIRANLPTCAFRIPSLPLTRELLTVTGPLVMPSANISGRPSSTCKEHVEADFGKEFPVLNGGMCLKGVESTILYYNEENKVWQIIRQGALTKEAFLHVLHYEPEIVKPKPKKKPICPGQFYRHYAPKAKLILTKKIPEKFSGTILGFDSRSYPKGVALYSLGEINQPEMAAKKLYHTLRQLDLDRVDEALVDIDIPAHGIFTTILERLHKAAG